jgi:tripartite-type tricarboxylate transporter receptor subunit TctC
MSDRNCSTCAFWFEDHPARADEPNVNDGVGAYVGVCQTAPPVMVDTQRAGLVSVYPVTHASRSCRFWQAIPDDEDDGERVVVQMERRAA